MVEAGYVYIGSAFHQADQRLNNRRTLANLSAAVRELRAMEAAQRAKYHKLVASGTWTEGDLTVAIRMEKDCRRKWFAWVREIRAGLVEKESDLPAVEPLVVNSAPAPAKPPVTKRRTKAPQPTLFDLW